MLRNFTQSGQNRRYLKKSIILDIGRIQRYKEICKRQSLSLSDRICLKLITLRLVAINRGFRSVYLYRLAHHAYANGGKTRLLFYIFITKLTTTIEVSYNAEILPGLHFPHPQCIVISNAKIGSNCIIFQGVTIGSTPNKGIEGSRVATIGNNVILFSGSKLIGPIRIGDNVIVGANAVVVHDVPSDSIVVGNPARVLPRIRNMEEYLYSEPIPESWYS